MKWTEVGRQECSVARALSVVGDRWMMLIIREAFMRTRRFDDFQRNVGASRNIVADRLQKLVADGILERRLYEKRPPRFEYRLTAKGLDLYPVLTSLLAWGDRWMADDQGPPLDIVHAKCGKRTVPRLTCGECGDALEPREVAVRRREPGQPLRRG